MFRVVLMDMFISGLLCMGYLPLRVVKCMIHIALALSSEYLVFEMC